MDIDEKMWMGTVTGNYHFFKDHFSSEQGDATKKTYCPKKNGQSAWIGIEHGPRKSDFKPQDFNQKNGMR